MGAGIGAVFAIIAGIGSLITNLIKKKNKPPTDKESDK